MEKVDLIKELLVLIDYIDRPNRECCGNLLNENSVLMLKSPGSSHNHQAWEGGYLDHVAETMRVGHRLFYALGNIHDLPFTLSDVMLVLFLHDLEKPWKYVAGIKFADKRERRDFRYNKIKEYGIELTPGQINAIDYVEGEIHDYSNTERKMGPLAALCHMADIASARLWPEQRF